MKGSPAKRIRKKRASTTSKKKTIENLSNNQLFANIVGSLLSKIILYLISACLEIDLS